MKDNLQQWKTTITGVVLAILGLLQLANLVTPEQVNGLTSSIPVIGDKLLEIFYAIAGLLLIFARDPKRKIKKEVL